MKSKLFLFTCAGLLLHAETQAPRMAAPFYTTSSIVNAANIKAGPLAPNTIGTLYGRDLAFTTRAVSSQDLYNGTLPTTLLGTGVRLLIDKTLAFVYFVSPTQINFLVPSTLTPGASEIQLVLDGRAAPSVKLDLAAVSPALFAVDPETALATHLNGGVVTAEQPASPNEIVILYATGLGATRPRLPAGQMPTGIAWIERASDFQVTLDGEPVDRANILYAGAAPGFAGLYQINLRLPTMLKRNPEVQIGFEGAMSPADVRLPTKPATLRAKTASTLVQGSCSCILTLYLPYVSCRLDCWLNQRSRSKARLLSYLLHWMRQPASNLRSNQGRGFRLA